MSEAASLLDGDELSLLAKIKRECPDFEWPNDLDDGRVQAIRERYALSNNTYRQMMLFQRQPEAVYAPDGVFRPYPQSASMNTGSSPQNSASDSASAPTSAAKRPSPFDNTRPAPSKKPRKMEVRALDLLNVDISHVRQNDGEARDQELVNAGAAAMIQYLEADIVRSAATFGIQKGYQCTESAYTPKANIDRLLELKLASDDREHKLEAIYADELLSANNVYSDITFGPGKIDHQLQLLQTHIDGKAMEQGKLWVREGTLATREG